MWKDEINMAKVLGIFDNPLPAPLNNNYGVFILDLIIWIVIILGIYFLIEVGIKRITKKTKTELDDIVFRIIRRPILVLLVLFAFITSLRALEQEWWMQPWIYDLVDKMYFIVLVVIGLFVGYKLFKNVVVYYGKIYAEKTETDIDDVMIPVAEKLGAVIILIAGVAILLGYIGIDLTMLAVGSIVISMVIAFALQDTLSNFFAGIYLLTDRPFKVGDWIILESEEICQVKQVGMRSVRLYKMFDHADLILPNNKIASQKILNITMPDEQAKVKIKLGVAYGTDIKKVKELLIKSAMEHPNVLKDEGKMPLAIFTDFGESSLDFLLLVWVDNIMNQWKVARELRESINEKFLKEDIEIPFPQRVVWHKDEDKIFTSLSHQKE